MTCEINFIEGPWLRFLSLHIDKILVKYKGAVPITFGTVPFKTKDTISYFYLETASLTIFPDLSNVNRA